MYTTFTFDDTIHSETFTCIRTYDLPKDLHEEYLHVAESIFCANQKDISQLCEAMKFPLAGTNAVVDINKKTNTVDREMDFDDHGKQLRSRFYDKNGQLLEYIFFNEDMNSRSHTVHADHINFFVPSTQPYQGRHLLLDRKTKAETYSDIKITSGHVFGNEKIEPKELASWRKNFKELDKHNNQSNLRTIADEMLEVLKCSRNSSAQPLQLKK